MRLRLQGHYFPKIGLFSVQDNYFAISPHKIVMWKCFRLSALRRSLGATPWWWPRRWPRSNRQHLVGFSWNKQIKSLILLFSAFTLSSVDGEGTSNNKACWVFRDTELEIFPWQGTLKVESEPRLLEASLSWWVSICAQDRNNADHSWRTKTRTRAAALQHRGLAAVLPCCPQLQQWTKKLPCDYKLIWLGFKSSST